MPTTFKKPINNLTTTLGAAYAPGSGTMTVRAGDGARFGVVSASSPIRFTCVKASGVDKNGQVNPIAAISIYFATGITGDTLTGVSVAEGTTDQSFVAGDFLTMVFTAGTILDIQGAVNTLETTSGADTTAINANTASINNHIADKANPHAVTAAQVGNNIAQWNASSLLGRALDAGVPPAGGQVLVWDAVNSKWVSGGAFWDLVNKRLGIGTATPGTNLHIDGAAGGTSAAMWMTSDGAVNHFADMLFGQGTNTGQYAEFIRYNAGSDAGFLPSDFGIANLLHRIFFSTAYNAGYRIDFLIDENGLVGIGPATGLAAQLTVESKDVARPAAVFRVAAGQTANAIEVVASDGATVLASMGPDGKITGQIGKPFSATDGNDVRMIDAPCTTAGKASMGISVAGTDFGGIGDPLVAFGYNLRASGGAIDTTEVAWGLKFEGDYLEQATGKRLSEGYIEFWPIGSTTSIRPWFIRMDRTQTDPTKALDTALYYGNPFLIGHPDGTLLAQIGKGETALFAGLSGASNTFKIAAAAGQGAVINLQYDGVDNAFQARTEAGSTALQSVNNFQVTAGSGGNVAVNLSGGGALVVNGGAIQVVFGAASGYIRHAATVLFQVGPGSATTTRADIGMGAINPALGSTVQTKADGSIAFVGINGTDSGSIDPTGTMTAANGLKLPTFADASAPDGSIFFGSDHLDGSSKAQLCRKQGGTVTVIG